MTSMFADIERIASAAVDSVYSEMTIILPQDRGQIFSSAASVTRAPVEVIGVVDYNPIAVTVSERGQYDGFQPTVAGTRIHVSYSVSSFANVADRPVEADIIVASKRPGQPRFKISRIDPDGLDRFICVCVPVQA